MPELTATHVLLLLFSGALVGAAVVLLRGMGRETTTVDAARERFTAALEAERALHAERIDAANADLEAANAERNRLREELRALGEQVTALREDRARLEARAEAQQRHDQERLQELENARKRMSDEFQNLANRILEEKGKALGEQSRSSLDALLKPVREQLEGFRRRVDEVHHQDVQQRAALQGQLDLLKQLNQQMNDEARNLTRALKGDKKAQGNWGELVLERVLEQCGLRAGHEYELQGSYRDADNRLLRPDVVVHLPEGKEIVIDSKVSLVAWSDYVAAEDEVGRERALRAHVAAVRNHVNALSAKDYTDLKGVRSLDFVLMFMPIEASFMAAFQHDEKLFGDAFEKRIAVVTPTTLLATMRTVESLWRNERQNENSVRIADQAGRVYDKLRGFLEDFERIGSQLATVQRSFDGARKKLTEGRGNLLSQAESFRELGIKVRKTIPRSLLDDADAPDEDNDEATSPREGTTGGD
ncbi:MAG: DNA recombination protein RmuC [Gammaproteobacteria bacterium]|jgi:DNA recombination protein RmuC|nr:DNA recombination protein RmuC [Gammaproteobacteria bacterium]